MELKKSAEVRDQSRAQSRRASQLPSKIGSRKNSLSLRIRNCSKLYFIKHSTYPSKALKYESIREEKDSRNKTEISTLRVNLTCHKTPWKSAEIKWFLRRFSNKCVNNWTWPNVCFSLFIKINNQFSRRLNLAVEVADIEKLSVCSPILCFKKIYKSLRFNGNFHQIKMLLWKKVSEKRKILPKSI